MKANNKSMQHKDDSANVEMITMGIIAAVMFAIAVPIIFNVMASLNLTTVNHNIATNVYGLSAGPDPSDDANSTWATYNGTIPASNATSSLITQVNSFFSIGPIYLVVVIAVGIIAAILVLRRFGG